MLSNYYTILKVDNDNKFSLLIIFKNNYDYNQINEINKVFNTLYIIENKNKKMLSLAIEITKYLPLIKNCYISNEIDLKNKIANHFII